MSNKIWAIGSIGIDMLAFASKLPAPGETMAGHDFMTAPGGKGLNQAIACARLGAPTSMIGCAGDDGFGQQVTTYMKEAGVDVSRVRKVPGMYTGVATICVADDGANAIVVVPGANGCVSPADVTALPYQAGDYLVAQFEVPLASTLAAFQAARSKGARCLLNPSPIMDGAADVMDVADIIVLNEIELAHYAGLPVTAQTADEQIIHAARHLIHHEGQTIVVTLGARGALAVNRQEDIIIPGRSVKAIDTVGAGDTFAGGLAARLLAGDTLHHAMEFANIAASLSVQKQGAAPSIPVLADVQAQKVAA